MEGNSVQPTIELYEVVAFTDRRGYALTPGIYVFTGDVLGRSCLLVKRIGPLPDDMLEIISDDLHYQTFTLNTGEQKDVRIHGRVVASSTVRHSIWFPLQVDRHTEQHAFICPAVTR